MTVYINNVEFLTVQAAKDKLIEMKAGGLLKSF